MGIYDNECEAPVSITLAPSDKTTLNQFIVTGPISIGASRITHNLPSNFRLAKYPDGSTVLQGCFIWSEGFNSGFDWKDIPIHIIEESQ